jgi:adenosylcobinamide-GDP ribazoletransferase
MTAPPPAPRAGAGLRFAFGTLTVLPVGSPRWDRETARLGMLCAPVAGLAIGLAAAGLAWVLLELETGWLLTAVVTVAAWAAFSRGLHLDGLADTADGLGSGRPAAQALDVMKRSDIGPFGVVTLVFALLAQVAAIYEILHHGEDQGLAAVVVGCLAGRAALSWACRVGMPPARADGLGAAVAECLSVGRALAAAGASCLAAAALGALTAGPAVGGAVAAASAVVLGVSAAEALLRHCRRRLGGVTGDTLGATAETATTVTLLVLAVTA